MPDRHGPLRVVYQERREGEEGVSDWQTFEDDTPDEVLDRITSGILRLSPLWLGGQLTEDERLTVNEYFGVEILPGDAEAEDL